MPQMPTVVLPPRLPLVVVIGARARTLNKDAKLINCYIETNYQGEVWVFKRPGLTLGTVLTAGAGQGIYQWRGSVYCIINGSLYRDSTLLASGLNSAGGTYFFSEILGATPKIVFGNGAKTYATDGITVSPALDTISVNFPATTVKGIVYLNGATYVMDAQGQIWGSVPNSVTNPTDWSAIDYVAAQIEPDPGVFLAKQLVYVVAFGSWSTEVFFDAGNATGSPLGPVQGSKVSYGCANALSVQSIDDRLIWISSTRSGAVQVSMLDQLNHRVISTKPVDRILQSSTLASVQSLQLKCDGHSFYIVTLKDVNTTLVYDINEDQWHVWNDASGNYFPYMYYTYDNQHRHILQHESNGQLYFASPEYFNDAGNKITVDIFTPLFDGNTNRRKQLNILKIIADQEIGSSLQARCTNDDYQTWTNFRKLDLSKKNPQLVNCGTFVRRAYHFRHESNTRMRLQAVEVQYDIGTL